ncbi:MAG TPA: helix-turn-helix transcriptional regulator [Tahibacter sp.]|uniref:helix-turn-helix domain-containing protein n=1 Tax=Tahibacter sp. TaxID=2056211 RepID=UPI002C7164D2|nr:helix-turn-helix transcriptional regulator [Tahibacter sp.]HSX61619.1 helix-turn-helix transcriptional regulator [Tahibacter sp.]
MKTFASRLKEFRKASGLTQEQIALELGFTKAAVSAWELGNNEPSIAALKVLRDLLGVSVDELVGESSDRSSGTVVLSAKEKQLIQLFRKLSPAKRTALLLLLDQ